MRSLRRGFLFAFGLLAAACGSLNYTADLARNDLFYVDVPFATKSPGDRPVHVLPVADARDASVMPAHERGFPITYAGDDFWERPVPVMVGDVLLRQLHDSRLFPAVCDGVQAEALLVKPTLVAFTTASIEGISGSRSFAEVGLKLQVFGPANGNGKRSVLLERVYANRQATQQELHPTSPYRLVGRALQQAISKALLELDGSNIARSTVPDDRKAEIEIAVEAATSR